MLGRATAHKNFADCLGFTIISSLSVLSNQHKKPWFCCHLESESEKIRVHEQPNPLHVVGLGWVALGFSCVHWETLMAVWPEPYSIRHLYGTPGAVASNASKALESKRLNWPAEISQNDCGAMDLLPWSTVHTAHWLALRHGAMLRISYKCAFPRFSVSDDFIGSASFSLSLEGPRCNGSQRSQPACS
jgi:hypothetical protein